VAFKDLRAFLKKIEAADTLVRVKKEVDFDQEISAAIIKAGAAALFCERVKGYDIPVVANLFADRRKIEGESPARVPGRTPRQSGSQPRCPPSSSGRGSAGMRIILSRVLSFSGGGSPWRRSVSSPLLSAA